MKQCSVALTLVLTVFLLSACSSGDAGSGVPTDAASIIAGDIPVGGDCYNMDAASCEAFKATNVQRAMNGVQPLKYCQTCFEMAFEQSQYMYETGQFDHNRAGETFYQRVARFGLGKGAGENLAYGTPGEEVVTRWMNSAGHRANILNPSFKSFAVATYGKYSTQVFYADVDR